MHNPSNITLTLMCHLTCSLILDLEKKTYNNSPKMYYLNKNKSQTINIWLESLGKLIGTGVWTYKEGKIFLACDSSVANTTIHAL